MPTLKRAQWMLGIVALGLFISGVTVWPAVWELKTLIHMAWGEHTSGGALHQFLLRAIEGMESLKKNYPFLWYGYDWLAFAHIMLAILFAGAIRNPVRNIWVVQCGLIMCVLIPVLAGICVPIRGLPLFWFWIDFAFAPAAALPLIIALRDIMRVEKLIAKS